MFPYFSGRGHTARIAGAVAEGTGGARLIDVEAMVAADWTALDGAEVIVFGSPTYMGSVAARYEQFLEEAADRWDELPWADRIATATLRWRA